MEQTESLKIVARIRNNFHDKFGIPRQSGLLSSMKSVIVFEKEYRNPDALRGIEDFSHLWLLWLFSENIGHRASGWKATVRPPRLGGNTRIGVFASRSPFRPNPIGLSCVRLERCVSTEEFGTVLVVSGADLLNGTPIVDIKPYVAYADAHPKARSGFADAAFGERLTVECPEELLAGLNASDQRTLLRILAEDPRPSYQNEPDRIYKMDIGRNKIEFRVQNGVLYVLNIYENSLPFLEDELLSVLDGKKH